MGYEIEGYRLEVVREPADGPVVSVLVHHADFDGEPAPWSDNDLTHILRAARELDGDRDPRSEVMPSDDALLRACLADLCIEVEAAPAAPLLQRLGEAHDGLSDLSGIVVSHECMEAVSDAYDTLASLRDALFDIAQKAEWAAMPAAGAVERQTALSEIAAAARAAIAKVGG